jgi:hypothetical protein
MASVPFTDLVELVKSSPKYYREWDGRAPADVALAIAFWDPDDSFVRTETLEIANGLSLVIDFDATGKVTGIEIG